MKKLMVMSVVMLSLGSVVCALETAGTLAVDLDVNDLSAVQGAKITSWANDGSLGGAFTNVTAGQGSVFHTNIAGAAAVEFTGNANTVMKSPYGVPAELTTNNSWSVEVWIYNPVLAAGVENYLSWTPRGDYDGIGGSPTDELMELRFYNSTAQAIEHYGNNLEWGRGLASAGNWHHLVATRDKTTNVERFYVDGGLYNQKVLATLRIRPDGIFVLGATQNGAKTGYENYFSGYLGKVRVHTGTLSATQVIQNYAEERDEYGVSVNPDSIWQGAAGTPLDWNDPANWVEGFVAQGGSYLAVDNGGIAVLTNSLGGALNDITSGNGGLVVSNNATLSIAGNNDQLGVGSGNTHSLTVASGKLAFTGSNNHSLAFGVNGATANAVIGVDGTAELEIDRDMTIGQSGGTGIVTVASGGSLACLNGWQYIGIDPGSYGKVTVNGGFFGSIVNTLNIRVAENGAAGELVVNSGTVACNGDLMLAAGNSTATTDAEVRLNGGLTHVRRLFAEDAVGSAMLYLNGGTIRNRDSRGDFLFNLDAALIQSGGVTFDIISGTRVTVNQPLLEDSGSTGGGITKTGEGILILGGTNTFTGDITVNAGGLVFNVADGIVAGYSGEIVLTDAMAAVGYNKAGGIDELLALIDTNSVGKIIVLPANAADDIDFSEYPNLELAFADGVDYTGTFTPYGSTYSFYPVGTGNLFAQSVAGTSNFEVYGGIGDQIEFTGDSSFSGYTLIDGCELIMSHSNALGTGSITLTNSAVLRLNTGNLPATFAQRITAGSKGFIMLTTASAAVDLDLAGIPGVQVGTFLNSLTYTGAITPANSTYRFTGGGQQMRVSGNNGLVLSNLDGASAVEVVNGNDDRTFVNGTYTGGITLGSGNSYTGGTVITNKGLVRVNSDAFGAVPAVEDPDNIYVDNGCIRLGNANVTFNENRGLQVGPGGLEVHPWSGYTFNFNGPLSGSGDIFSTDGGTVYFGGTNNTWSGDLQINGGRTLGIGFGGRFSWNNSAPIVGLGGTFALRYDGDLTWSSEFDNPLGTDGASLTFRKEGSGTLTVDVDPVYTGNTLVQGGTLKVASADAIPNGSGFGDLNISGGAAVDVNGYNVEVNGLDGAGDVTDSDGGAATFTVGIDNSGGSFSGTIEPGQLIKNGSGTQTLTTGAELQDATVNAGVLALQNPVAPTGDVVIAGSATLRITGNGSKLVGQFYNYNLADQTVLNTVSGVETLFAGRTPNVTAAVGATMDFGSTGGGFPAPYNNAATENFIAKWEGLFYAPVTGEYTFRTRSDDGSSLIIDGQMVVANGALQSYAGSDETGTITLTTGYHDFLLAFSEVGGGQGLTLDMAYPGGTLAVMPTSLLTDSGESEIASITSATTGLLEIQDGAALALNVDADTTFDGRIDAGTSDGAVLIKRGAGTLSLDPNGHDVDGMTAIREGTLHIANDGGDIYGPMQIDTGAQLSVDVDVARNSVAPISGMGLLGYYYDYGSAETAAFEAALNSGNLNTLETFLAGQTIDRIENSTTSADVFSFGNGYNGIGAFPPGYETTDYFSAIWYGQIVIPSSGSYKFQTNSDDGSMLYIDGSLVVNNSGRHGAVWKEGTVSLTAGTHDIVVTFFEVTGGDHVVAQIDMGSGWVNLPNSMLRPTMAEIGAVSGTGTLTVDAAVGGLLINQGMNTTFAGDVAGTNTAVIFKGGASTLTLTGDNSAFYGSWSVQEGTLQVGDGVTSCDLGGSNVYVRAGATLLFNCPDDTVYDGTVSGGGLIRSIGGGQLTLSGNLSGFTGVLDIGAGGVLEMSSTSVLAIPVVTNAGVFIVGEGIMLAGVEIAGDGTTIVAEGGSLDIGSNPMLNDIELDGGMLMAVGTNVLSSLAVSTNGTSELILDLTADGDEFGVVDLVLEAGSRLETYPAGGLMSRYYDARPVDATYTSVLAFTNWAAGQTVTIYTNTSAQPGDNLQFGNTGSLFPGKYSSGALNFSALYQGRIVIAIPGEYTFGVSSDDNGMLFIDDVLIVDNNGGHAYALKTGTVTLTAGVHDFCLLFGQGGGGYGLTAYITYPGQSASQIIPNSILIPLDADAQMAYTLAADAVSVINAPGAGTVDMNVNGTLTFPDLAVELGANLAVEGAVAVDGATLDVTVDQEITAGGKVLLGDFSATDGLDLGGVTMTLTGSEGNLLYRDKKLYVYKTQGTVIILR